MYARTHTHTLKGFKASADIFKGHMLTEKVNRLWYRKEFQSKNKLSDIHKMLLRVQNFDLCTDVRYPETRGFVWLKLQVLI